jgi:hypothetical protein
MLIGISCIGNLVGPLVTGIVYDIWGELPPYMADFFRCRPCIIRFNLDIIDTTVTTGFDPLE